MTTCTN